jgi:hypothetical protein
MAGEGFSIEIENQYIQRHDKLRVNKCHCQDATKVDYEEFIIKSNMGNIIDYLSVDADPPHISLSALKKVPHEKYKFRVITFEHDYSAGGVSERLESRKYLSDLGCQLIVSDISWGHRVVEDWWIHPDLTDKSSVNELTCIDNNIHEHDKYV